jgi:hypothetical protein
MALPSGGGGSELDEVAAGGASGAVGNAAEEDGPSSGYGGRLSLWRRGRGW